MTGADDAPAGPSARNRMDVADELRSGSEKRERPGGLTGAAALAAPACIVGAVVVFLVPTLNRVAPALVLALLTLAPMALSLAWRRGGSPARAWRATAGTAVLVAVAAGALGLLANRCVADPLMTSLLSIAIFTGTLLVATMLGRALARAGLLVGAVVLAGIVGFLGFYGALMVIGQRVFVLC